MVAEIASGELYASTSHARVASVANRDLVAYDDELAGPRGPGGWWILFEPELYFGADVLAPDLAGWRRERLPRVLDAPCLEFALD